LIWKGASGRLFVAPASQLRGSQCTTEYLHHDFGNNSNFSNTLFCTTAGACTACSNWRVFDTNLTVDTVKLGVNYHLTSGYVPLK
jgi:hypothetical protein